GEMLWCQGFSEPGSGSDLASASLRAVKEGDHYIFNGSKIWTTGAHHSDMMFCLARTDLTAKHRGLSFFLIDMTYPGITIRPIVSIDGQHHLNQVFFDDVKVPISQLVGEQDQAWNYTKFVLR